MSFPTTRLRFTCSEPLKYGANAAAQFDNPEWPRFVRITDITDDGRLKDETFRSLPPQEAEPYLLEDGDLLLARSGSIGRSFIYRPEWGKVCHAGYLIRARLSESFDPKYVFWALNTSTYWAWVESIAIRSTIQNVSAEKYADFAVPTPKFEDQKRIAAFLDEKTAQIDGLIAKKQALLERLAEKRKAIITQAVTKGLNPAAVMKDSGINWLGQIPAHWEVQRLSFVSQIIDCKHRTPEYIDDGIPLVSTTEISPYMINYRTKRQVSHDELAIMSEGGRQPRVGDIIYSRNASVGSAALVRDDRTICLGQDLCLVRPSTIQPEFLEHFLNSTACLVQLGSYLVGTTFKRVNVDVIKKYALPLPPPEEQMAIAEKVSVAMARAEAIERKVSDSISALGEYRSAIITSAVTGQIEGLQ